MNIYTAHRTRILFIIFTATTLSANVRAAETGSSHNLFYLNKLTDKTFFVGRGNLVTRDGFSDTFFGYVDGNLRYKLSGLWSVELGYRQAFLELPSGWREEYRPMLGLIWRGKLFDGKFSNRHRMEWRYFEGNAKNRQRYRNESVWISAKKISEFQLTPFIEEEFFYDITDNELNGNWLTFGVSKYWTKDIKWKLGYRLQSQKLNGTWDNRHMLVTGISFFSFD